MRYVLSLLLIVLFALPSNAADVTTEIDQLVAAVDARLSAGATGKEARKLRRVVTVAGKTSPPVLADQVAKVLLAVLAAKSTDTAVEAELADLLQCLCDDLNERRDELPNIIGQAPNPGDRVKLNKKVPAVIAKIDKAKALVATNPKRAVKLLRSAFRTIVRVVQKVKKLVQKGPTGSGGLPRNLSIFQNGTNVYAFVNGTKKSFFVKDIILDGNILVDGAQFAPLNKASSKAAAPQLYTGFNTQVINDRSFFCMSELMNPLLPANTPRDFNVVVRIVGNITIKTDHFGKIKLPIDFRIFKTGD